MKLKKRIRHNRNQVIRLFTLLTVVTFIIVVSRFTYIMVGGKVGNVNIVEKAEKQYEESSVLPAKRGTIYDVGGNPLAIDATSYTLRAILTTEWVDKGAQPNYVPSDQHEHYAEVLSKHLSMSKEDIKRQLDTPDVKQIYFGDAGSNLSYAEMDAIKKENLKGIEFDEQPSRLYPNGKFASHLIGYAKFQEAQSSIDNRLQGMMGIEKAEDNILAGENGYGTTTKSLTGSNEKTKEPVAGRDIYTTIDSRLETYLETLVEKMDDTYHPEKLVAMLVEPSTGKIVAATQRPTFNAQTLEGVNDMWKNLLIEESYEPGSTMKVLTVAAAIQEGIFDPNKTYQSGSITVDGTKISDWNEVGWGTITELNGLAHSSNVLAVKLVQAIGYDKWKQYMLEFGLGQTVDSGLGNEDTGYISYDSELGKANTSFGQGIRVTPWQLVQAFTAIANGGKMMRLQTIDRVEDKNGNLQFVEPKEVDAPISAQTAKKTLQYLTSVVNQTDGSGHIYQIEGTQISAKTGTGEIYDEKQGKYLPHTFYHSVVGFAPTDNPQYIFYLAARGLKTQKGKGPEAQLAEIFVPFVTRSLEYSKLSASDNTQTATLPDVTNQSVPDAEQTMTEKGFVRYQTIGSGQTVTAQYPSANETVATDSHIFLLTDGEKKMPDFSGLKRTEAEALAHLLNLTPKFNGEGNVIGQSLSSGSSITDGQTITFELSQN
ncbi:MAG: penicillin-binding transpeptidase domain-containing protein [Aerococcus sp.]|nr:penicillin-binding transpeptidase domain-containing protein [Aerococcus sp.]